LPEKYSQTTPSNIKPLEILLLKIEKIPTKYIHNNSIHIDEIPKYLIRFICYKTGLTFFSFSHEKSNLVLSIFADYILNKIKKIDNKFKNISIVTNKSSVVYSINKKSLFQNVLKRHNIKQILKNNKDDYSIIDNSNFLKNGNDLIFLDTKDLLFRSFAFSLFYNNKILEDENCKYFNNIAANSLNIPPIELDKYIKNIDDIKTIKDYWKFTDKQTDIIKKEIITYLKKTGDNQKDNFNNEQAIVRYDLLIDILKTADTSPVLRIETLLSKGQLFLLKGDYSGANKTYYKALAIAKEKKEIALANRILELIGNYYFISGEYPKSEKYLKMALRSFTDAKDNEGVAAVYNSLGNLFRVKGKLDRAIDYLKSAVKIGIKNNFLGSIQALGGLGVLYYEINNSKESISYFENYLAKSKKIKYYQGVSTAYIGLATNYYLKGDIDKNGDFLEKSLNIAKKTGEISVILANYNNLAINAMNKNNFEIAKNYCSRHLKMAIKIKNKSHMAHANFTMGLILLEMENYFESLTYLDKAIAIFEKIKTITQLIYVYHTKIDILLELERYDEALKAVAITIELLQKTDNRSLHFKTKKYRYMASLNFEFSKQNIEIKSITEIFHSINKDILKYENMDQKNDSEKSEYVELIYIYLINLKTLKEKNIDCEIDIYKEFETEKYVRESLAICKILNPKKTSSFYNKIMKFLESIL